jgi:hypothetical protein
VEAFRRVDPQAITNFSRSQGDLEAFMVFAVFVAGKNAAQQAVKAHAFLTDSEWAGRGLTPFSIIRQFVLDGKLREKLEAHKIGQYTRISKTLKALAFGRDIRYSSLADLEAIVGPKTARFFLLHAREGSHVAALDTHILKWLNEMGVKAPKSTPAKGDAYRKLELAFLELAEAKCAHTGMTLAELDLEIWRHYNNAPRKRGNKNES